MDGTTAARSLVARAGIDIATSGDIPDSADGAPVPMDSWRNIVKTFVAGALILGLFAAHGVARSAEPDAPPAADAAVVSRPDGTTLEVLATLKAAASVPRAHDVQTHFQ